MAATAGAGARVTVSSPFIIRELTGDQRILALRGRALPYRPLTLNGEQRVEVEFYPGVPEGTATVLGPTEKPTDINGFWKTKFLGDSRQGTAPFMLDNEPVFTARDAVRAVDSVRLLGQLLEVTWLDTLRRGFLRAFEQKWHTSEDVEWRLTFEWISRGEVTAPAVLVNDASVGDAFSDVSSLFGFLDSIQLPTLPLADEVIAGLQAFVNGIGNAILSAEDAVVQLTDKVLSPVRAVRGLVATLQSLEDEAGLMLEFLTARTDADFGSSAAGSQGYSERLSAALYREELKAWAQELRRTSVERRTSLLRQVTTTLLATYVAREGDDLRDVARQFYGTPFEWRRLLTFNDLSSMQLEAGQLILIPPLASEQAGQQLPGV